MKELAYLQCLDTVRFNPEINQGRSLRALLDEGFVNSVLYGVFYQIVLAPNQVFDLPLLRDKRLDLKDLASYPFILTLDSRDRGKTNPFTAQLLRFLRRAGVEAFVFGSMPTGAATASNWANFLEREGKDLSDTELLHKARDYYGEIVAWAERLDREAKSLWIGPYSVRMTFTKAYSDVLELRGVGSIAELPLNRSIIYRNLSGGAVSFEYTNESRADADLAASVQYATSIQLGDTSARLVLAPDSPYLPPADATASLYLDLHGLLTHVPEVHDAVLNADLDSIARASEKARPSIEEGWKILGKDKAVARSKFAEGLRVFLNEIGSPRGAQHTYAVSVSLTSLGLSGPFGKLMMKQVQKWKLRGIDKFIKLK